MQKRKSNTDKTVEGYFPVDESDIKDTTDKKVREDIPDYKDLTERKVKSSPNIESVQGAVEKRYNKPTRSELETVIQSNKKKVKKITRKKYSKKKTTKKKTTKKKSIKKTKFTPPNIKLKKSGYELIITEKPQAANKIATALDDKNKPTQKQNNKIAYYELTHKKQKIVVACAVGHLLTLSQNVTGTEVPTFDISWTPNYLVRKKDFTKRYFDTILKLAKGASSVTIATDFDVEGEVIGMTAVKYICGQSDANRMKFSTLTPKELNQAYESKLKTINWGQAIAGETRHYLDWYYGINLSRALMNAIKTTGKFKIMSIGRVQGPALNLIVKKEKEIKAFKPKTYWQVFITIKDSKNKLELKYIKDIFDKKFLENFKDIIGKKANAITEKKSEKISPPVPFNLTTLQTEAYKFHGITPANTLKASQSLYLAGLISYPRTSSQKLPDSIEYKPIKEKLAKAYNVSHLMKKEKPIQGKKTDPAHPSIYPTGNTQILSGDEDKIYNLIVKRFLSLFCEDAELDHKKIKANLIEKPELIFSAKGQEIKKKAWLEIYPSKLKDNQIPDFEGEVDIIDLRTEQKETQPPKRYSPASIISQLEKKNLGTKATRSTIIETLFDRGYVQGQSVEATPLGISLIETLEKHSPIIIDEELTRNFEKEMQKIENAKKGFLEKEKEILEKAQGTITKIAKDFKKNEKEIGKELIEANIEYREKQKQENKLLPCPKCKQGDLIINYSKKTRRFFVACDAYPNCTNTYTLPPNGIIKKPFPEKNCEECNYPMLMRLSKGKRPWTFCWNPQCPTNSEWANKSTKKNSEVSTE